MHKQTGTEKSHDQRYHLHQTLHLLNRAPGPTWTKATKRKAPHKSLLLLAGLDLVQRGDITTPFTGGASSHLAKPAASPNFMRVQHEQKR